MLLEFFLNIFYKTFSQQGITTHVPQALHSVSLIVP